jgi:hypothetical protein
MFNTLLFVYNTNLITFTTFCKHTNTNFSKVHYIILLSVKKFKRSSLLANFFPPIQMLAKEELSEETFKSKQ